MGPVPVGEVWVSKRKSRIGERHRVAEPPPHAPGKPWWTALPTSPPWPGHLEYARRFRTELATRASCTPYRKRTNLQRMLTRVNAWIKEANRIAGDAVHLNLGLQRADDLWIEADRLISALGRRSGFVMTDDEARVRDAVTDRANAARERRLAGKRKP